MPDSPLTMITRPGDARTAVPVHGPGRIPCLALLLAGILLFWPGSGYAQQSERKWSVSPVLGIHSPKLTALNKGEFRAPLPGIGVLIFEDDENVDFDFLIENPLPEMRFGTEAGIEFGLKLDDRNSLFFGASVWESGSTSSVLTEVPFQGTLTPVGYERSATISYFQYFIGWQRILASEARKYNFYGRLSLNQVFDISYKEDIVFGFEAEQAGDDPFKRIIVMQSRATGLAMLQLGLGGEYFIREWLSLSGDLGYTMSARKFRLGNATLSSNIQPEDNLNLRTPVRLDGQGNLQYLAEVNTFDDVVYRDLELGFDGWKMLFRVNLYL